MADLSVNIYHYIMKKKSVRSSFTSEADGLEVTFTDTSTRSPRAWVWDFGDGETSAEQNPVHTYAEAGTYTVTLTALNRAGGRPASAEIEVESAVADWQSILLSYDPLVAYRVSETASPAVNIGTLGSAQDGTFAGAGWTFSQTGLTGAANAADSLSGGGSASRIDTAGYSSSGGTFTALVLYRMISGAVAAVNFVQDNLNGFTFGVDGSGRIVASTNAGAATAQSAAGVIVADADWNLMAVTLDEGNLTIYHSKTGTVSDVTDSRTGAQVDAVTFGTTQQWARRMNTSGTRFDELAMFDAALTLPQLQALADTLVWS